MMDFIKLDSPKFIERIEELALKTPYDSEWVDLACLSPMLLCFVWGLSDVASFRVLAQIMKKANNGT